MTYQVVIVPPSVTLRATTVALLGKFVAAGGNVLFLGKAPGRWTASPRRKPGSSWAGRTCPTGAPPPRIRGRRARPAETSRPVPARPGALLPRRVSIVEDGGEATFVWSMLRQVKGGQLLFLQSHDRKAAHRVTVCVRGQRPVVLWDARDGAQTRVKAGQDGDRAEFIVDLPPTGSALLSLGGPRAGCGQSPRRRRRHRGRRGPRAVRHRTLRAQHAAPGLLHATSSAWRASRS